MLKFITIVILVILVLRLVGKLIFPWAVRKATKKMMENAQNFRGNGEDYGYQHQQYSQSQPDGKIRVDYVPPKVKPKMKPNEGGEFVDFEEIK